MSTFIDYFLTVWELVHYQYVETTQKLMLMISLPRAWMQLGVFEAQMSTILGLQRMSTGYQMWSLYWKTQLKLQWHL